MRTFIPGSSVVHTHSFGNESQESAAEPPRTGDSSAVLDGDTLMLLEDEVVKISAVLLRPGSEELSPGNPGKRQGGPDPRRDEIDSGSLSPSKRFQASRRNSSAKNDGLSLSFAEPWELGFESETTSDVPGSQKRPRLESPVVTKSPSVDGNFVSEDKYLPSLRQEARIPSEGRQGATEVAVVYICELPEIIGKFDPQKAQAIGLRPGPKYGQLQAGKSVLADDGKRTVGLDIFLES